ncbi:hypothetical protein HDU93_001605 [Gonapodya sp. JEL0774]|nr:hypothetical protein HDU93_001605 [Gonapodya sp. JEL0774]
MLSYVALALLLVSSAMLGMYSQALNSPNDDLDMSIVPVSPPTSTPQYSSTPASSNFQPHAASNSNPSLSWTPETGIGPSLPPRAAPRPWTGRSPPKSRKNYVITLASGYSVQDLSPFFRSWALHSPETRIVVFTDLTKLTPQHTRLFRESRIHELINAPVLDGWVPHTTRIKVWAEWMTARLAEEEAAGIPDDESEYGFILNADVRDTIVQRDPWHQPVLEWVRERRERFNQQYVVFAPEWQVEIATEPTGGNRAWIHDCFGPEALEEIGSRPVSCSGVTMGSFRGMVQYWQEMWAMLKDGGIAAKCQGKIAADQGLHNYLLHHTLFLNSSLLTLPSGQPHPPLKYVQPTYFDSPVYTAHYSPPLGVNSRGEVVRPSRAEMTSDRAGTVIELIHQYDRHGGPLNGVKKWLRYVRAVQARAAERKPGSLMNLFKNEVLAQIIAQSSTDTDLLRICLTCSKLSEFLGDGTVWRTRAVERWGVATVEQKRGEAVLEVDDKEIYKMLCVYLPVLHIRFRASVGWFNESAAIRFCAWTPPLDDDDGEVQPVGYEVVRGGPSRRSPTPAQPIREGSPGSGMEGLWYDSNDSPVALTPLSEFVLSLSERPQNDQWLLATPNVSMTGSFLTIPQVVRYSSETLTGGSERIGAVRSRTVCFRVWDHKSTLKLGIDFAGVELIRVDSRCLDGLEDRDRMMDGATLARSEGNSPLEATVEPVERSSRTQAVLWNSRTNLRQYLKTFATVGLGSPLPLPQPSVLVAST